MKKIATYISAMLLAVSNFSCSDYLDKEVDLSLSADQVFSSYQYTREFLANIYTYLPDAFAGYTNGQYLAASRDCMTDNCISFWNVHYYHSVLQDNYSSQNHYFAETYWPNNYSGIRACNQFLTNVRESVVGNSETDDDDNCLYDRFKAEARLMRAIFHFDLICWFGDCAIVGDDEEGNPIIFDPADTGSMNMERTSAADALQWVIDECDAIKDNLPFRYTNETENWGRVNGAAAYALKSRAALYLASPLNNPTGNTSLWQAAATAATDFIAKNNQQKYPYQLYTTDGGANYGTGDTDENYYQCFVTTPYYNDEYILSRSVWTTYDIELYLCPIGFSGTAIAVGRTNPTQNFVDCYETSSGKFIDEDGSGYDDQDPYSNRDPRLEQTILHHGSIWGDEASGEQVALDITYGTGTHYQASQGGTLTGYYTKKFLNNISWSSPTTCQHACPIFRYAEILLNAAEALNEAGSTASAYQYVNQVRARVGMPSWSTSLSQSEFRERIRNERRIELCFEDHHYFDERRWELFEDQTYNSEAGLERRKQIYHLYGVRITSSGSNTVYTYVDAQSHPTRSFSSPKNYYFPIPYEEVQKAPNLGQNTGW